MVAYRAMPSTGGNFPVVLVVSEVFGVHEYIKDVCRRLAKDGYFAIAPELFARQGDPTKYTDTSKLLSEVVAKTPDAQMMGDLDACVAFAKDSGKAEVARLGITGFCWGGRIVYMYTAHNPNVKAAVAWYGQPTRAFMQGDKTPMDLAAQIKVPVLGLYGGADQGIPNDTVEKLFGALKAARPEVDVHDLPRCTGTPSTRITVRAIARRLRRTAGTRCWRGSSSTCRPAPSPAQRTPMKEDRGEVDPLATKPTAKRLNAALGPSVRLGRGGTLHLLPAELDALLRSIRRHGSIGQALREMRMSHRSALTLLGEWEAITGHKLAVLKKGQGTGLTPFGERIADAREWLARRVGDQLSGVAGEFEEYLAVRREPALKRIVVHASHDIALLKLKEQLRHQLEFDLRFEGSLVSLDSLARGGCDIAGFHLPEQPHALGPEQNEFVHRLNPRGHAIVRLFTRQQGLLVGKAARRKVRTLRDLAASGVRFVNRERGSGTRLLLDALLAQEAVDPATIAGYDNEELTHMATAATVRSGMADAAFGIEAAARVHGLHFVPLVAEHYYLASKREMNARIALEAIANAARSAPFARAMAKIGGYDLSGAGTPVTMADIFASAS